MSQIGQIKDNLLFNYQPGDDLEMKKRGWGDVLDEKGSNINHS